MNSIAESSTTITCIAARLAFGLVIAFLVLVIVLHFLNPELDPSWRLISEYELGRYGWMMSLAFFCLGCASLTLVRGIWTSLHTRGGRIGRWGLLLIGIAFCGAGVFVTDPITDTTHSTAGMIHAFCGVVVILGFPIAVTLLGQGLASSQQPAGALRRLRWATLLVWTGFLPFLFLLSPSTL